MDLRLRLLTRAEADRVVRGRRDDAAGDLPWADGYPLDGDARACAAYVSHLPVGSGAGASDLFGYYQLVDRGVVVGGIGFHGPPREGTVEVGYGVVPEARGRGVATAGLRLVLEVLGDAGGVERIVGRTTEDNIASQRVMIAVGMQLVGRDPEFLHFELALLRPG